jgi:hypothetical protein
MQIAQVFVCTGDVVQVDRYQELQGFIGRARRRQQSK